MRPPRKLQDLPGIGPAMARDLHDLGLHRPADLASRDPQVMYDAVDAHYAETPAPIAAFCDRYEVDYLVVNERDFRDSVLRGGRYLWEPYDAYLRPRLQPVPAHLILRDLPPEQKAFQAGAIYVTACANFAS